MHTYIVLHVVRRTLCVRVCAYVCMCVCVFTLCYYVISHIIRLVYGSMSYSPNVCRAVHAHRLPGYRLLPNFTSACPALRLTSVHVFVLYIVYTPSYIVLLFYFYFLYAI